MSSSIELCALSDLKDGGAERFDIGDRELAVVRIDESVYIIGDRCSHGNVSLSGGEVDEDDLTLECPKHGSLFNLETGDALTLPATKPVPSYDTRVVDGIVYVEIEEANG